MEYRFFLPINETVYHQKWKIRSDLENRTDIYFILPPLSNHSDDFHLEHGLKLRNKKRLELKVREKRFPNGQEYWMKIIHSFKKIHIDDIDSIIKILRKSNQNQLIERLTAVQPLIICYVSKYRLQKGMARGLIQELTGLHLRFIRLNDQTQIGQDLFFETVCIEQSASRLMDETIIENLAHEYGNNSRNSMGYPEFLFRQYQQIINE